MSEAKQLTPQMLAMYLGSWAELSGFVYPFDNGRWVINGEIIHEYGSSHSRTVKPILRKLSSMTEEEKKEIFRMIFGREFVGDNVSRHDKGKKSEREVWWSGVSRLFFFTDGEIAADDDLTAWHIDQYKMTLHLLSKSFDLFNLIDSGLAIDESTLKP